MAIQLNIFRQTQHRVCSSSQVNMATADIAAFTHLSKSPAKSQISHWSLPSESKRVDVLLFKPNYAHAFKNQGYKNSKPPVTKSHDASWVSIERKEHGNNLLAPNIYVKHVKMPTLSRFKHFLCFVDTKNERYENAKLLIAKSSKESVIININVPCLCENERDAIRSQELVIWHIKMNFNSNRSLFQVLLYTL